MWDEDVLREVNPHVTLNPLELRDAMDILIEYGKKFVEPMTIHNGEVILTSAFNHSKYMVQSGSQIIS